MKNIFFGVLVIVPALFGMGNEHPPRGQRRVVVVQQPVIEIKKLQDFPNGSLEHLVYEKASVQARNFVASKNPVYNVRFCGGEGCDLVNNVNIASQILRQQYGVGEDWEGYSGELSGFFKIVMGSFRIMCSYDASKKTLIIHAIRPRTNAAYGDNETFAAAHQNCVAL